MKEIAEDSSPEVLEEVKVTKMNGTKNGSNNSNDVKYPANCAMRLGSSPDGDDTDIYEPKQNKKIWRILTVLVYVFTVSFGESNPYHIIWYNTLQQKRLTYYLFQVPFCYLCIICSYGIPTKMLVNTQLKVLRQAMLQPLPLLKAKTHPLRPLLP